MPENATQNAEGTATLDRRGATIGLIALADECRGKWNIALEQTDEYWRPDGTPRAIVLPWCYRWARIGNDMFVRCIRTGQQTFIAMVRNP